MHLARGPFFVSQGTASHPHLVSLSYNNSSAWPSAQIWHGVAESGQKGANMLSGETSRALKSRAGRYAHKWFHTLSSNQNCPASRHRSRNQLRAKLDQKEMIRGLDCPNNK